jgi:hypothetical protein
MPELTARDHGLGAAVDIQRRLEPRQWRAAVDAIADPAVRAVADEYLRGCVQRLNVVQRLKARRLEQEQPRKRSGGKR